MLSVNPFATLAETVTPIYMQSFVIVMLILIIIFLMLAFALTFYVDLLYTKKNIFPLWYLKLRKILSVVVFICLGLVAMAINNKII